MTGRDERLRLFEPLLDDLAAEFRLEATGPMESRGGPASARPVMERILVYLERESATERLGAAMAWYWAAPTLQYSTLAEFHNDLGRSDVVKHSLVPGEATPLGKNAEARAFMREFRPKIRAARLRAFLASEDLDDCRFFSQSLSLSLGDYLVELHPEVEAARQVAEEHPERFKRSGASW